MLVRALALLSVLGSWFFFHGPASVIAAPPTRDAVTVVFEDGGVVEVSPWWFRYSYKYSPCGMEDLVSWGNSREEDLLLELDRTTTTKRGVTESAASTRRIAGNALLSIDWEWKPRPAKGRIPDLVAVVVTLDSGEVLRLKRVTPSLDLLEIGACNPRDGRVALVGKARLDGKDGEFSVELESPAPDSDPANTVVRVDFANSKK